YSASASFAGDATHDASSDTKTFTIVRATSTVTASMTDYTYDGTPHSATGTTTCSGQTALTPALTFTYTGVSPTVYGPSSTPPVNAGTYQVVANFAGNAGCSSGTSSAVTFTINKAN